MLAIGLIQPSLSLFSNRNFPGSTSSPILPADSVRKKKSATTRREKILKDRKTSSISDMYLDIETIKEMLDRFLIEKKIPEEKLASMLEISVEELRRLHNKTAGQDLIIKVNLPLIKLYCGTKF